MVQLLQDSLSPYLTTLWSRGIFPSPTRHLITPPSHPPPPPLKFLLSVLGRYLSHLRRRVVSKTRNQLHVERVCFHLLRYRRRQRRLRTGKLHVRLFFSLRRCSFAGRTMCPEEGRSHVKLSYRIWSFTGDRTMRRRIGLSCEVHVDLCRSCLRIEDVVTCLYLNGSNSKDEIKERVYTLMIHLLRILFSRLLADYILPWYYYEPMITN